MLILSRTIDQEIIIGDNIFIKILGRRGDRISVGICAPHQVSVSRQKLTACKIKTPHRSVSGKTTPGACSVE